MVVVCCRVCCLQWLCLSFKICFVCVHNVNVCYAMICLHCLYDCGRQNWVLAGVGWHGLLNVLKVAPMSTGQRLRLHSLHCGQRNLDCCIPTMSISKHHPKEKPGRFWDAKTEHHEVVTSIDHNTNQSQGTWHGSNSNRLCCCKDCFLSPNRCDICCTQSSTGKNKLSHIRLQIDIESHYPFGWACIS